MQTFPLESELFDVVLNDVDRLHDIRVRHAPDLANTDPTTTRAFARLFAEVDHHFPAATTSFHYMNMGRTMLSWRIEYPDTEKPHCAGRSAFTLTYLMGCFNLGAVRRQRSAAGRDDQRRSFMHLGACYFGPPFNWSTASSSRHPHLRATLPRTPAR